MLSNVLISLGLMNKRARIGFWGPNVDEIAALVHALQTGEYAQQPPDIHPHYSEDFAVGDVVVAAGMPSGHESSRREWHEHLPHCDGTVYVVAFDQFELECLKELEGLLMDDALSNPMLILVPKDGPVAELRRELGMEEIIRRESTKSCCSHIRFLRRMLREWMRVFNGFWNMSSMRGDLSV